jgi:hypothetical protein
MGLRLQSLFQLKMNSECVFEETFVDTQTHWTYVEAKLAFEILLLCKVTKYKTNFMCYFVSQMKEGTD